MPEILKTGRITKGVGGIYSVCIPENNATYLCQARGKFRIGGISPLVGDIAEISVTDATKKTGYLINIKERKNEILRPRAANIDLIIVVFSAAKPAIKLDLLDSMLVSMECHIKNKEIIICINKSDIADEEYIFKIKQAYETAGYKTLLLSAKRNIGLEKLKGLITGKTSVVAGPSGVGKSSVLNIIAPDIMLATGEISKKIQRGKHTTRHAELFAVPSLEKTFIVDTPGFSSIDLNIDKNRLHEYFIEFRPFIGKCYYTDCRHITESGCAVKQQAGVSIDCGRYERYVKMYSNNQFF